ncbi:hypothetical protein F4678DRAFT_169565 [Xylaria arbuscula]|nr:hypothetical protein F4678DRAFT_169565 [Xylaria arbuscula]
MVQEMYHVNPQQGNRRHDGLPPRPSQNPHGGHQQGYPQGQPSPAQPRNINPEGLRRVRAVEISDVSRDLLSESDMKEELAVYTVFRFEKMADKDGFDDYGRPKWPSWEKAIRTEDRSISKQAAFNKIRELNASTKNSIDKKNSLPPPLKRQIDVTLEHLMSREQVDTKFHWILAQIDHQLRKVKSYYPSGSNQHYIPARKHRNSTLYPFLSQTGSHSKSSSHHNTKKKKKGAYERLTLTAYFKRTPLEGVDVRRLWDQKRRGLEGTYQALMQSSVFPPMHQPNHAPLQGQQQQQAQPPQFHQGREPPPPPMRMPNGNQRGPQMPHQNRPMDHNVRQQNDAQGPRHNMARQSDSDTDTEDDSQDSSSGQTPPSSVSDHRGGAQHHRNQHKNRQTHHVGVGAGPANNPRPQTPRNERPVGAGPNRPNAIPRTSLSPRRPPVPPYPVSSRDSSSVASHIEQIRNDAFRRGRLAERTDARLAEELAFTRAHARPRPHIVQERASPRVVYGERRGSDDSLPRYFRRLSVYDDDGDEELDEEDVELRREYERRVQQGSILEEDPFELNPSSASSTSYTYSTDGIRGRGRVRGAGTGRRGPQIIEIPERPHPPRLRRRMSYYP